MKKISALFLVFALFFTLTACGNDSDDPNCGFYECTKVSAMGMEMDVSDVLENGASLELNGGGKGKLVLDGDKFSMKWSVEGDQITLDIDGTESVGTLENGTITVDLMDIGMTYTFVQKAADGDSAE